MNRAIFLDRDGVLNKERGAYTYSVNDFEILQDVPDALLGFQNMGFKLIIISNQGGIAKGLYKKEDVEVLDKNMRKSLLEQGVEITASYYSPHHETVGNSISRKPDSLLLERAIGRFDIDPTASYMIGDKERDIFAAEKVGVQGIQIEANSSLLAVYSRILENETR